MTLSLVWPMNNTFDPQAIDDLNFYFIYSYSQTLSNSCCILNTFYTCPNFEEQLHNSRAYDHLILQILDQCPNNNN